MNWRADTAATAGWLAGILIPQRTGVWLTDGAVPSQTLSATYRQCFAESISLLAPPKSPGEGPVFNPKAAQRATGCRRTYTAHTPAPPRLHFRSQCSHHQFPSQAPPGVLPALTQVEGEVDGVGVLDAKGHGLALPPGTFLLAVEVGEEGDVVVVLGVAGIAAVAQGTGMAGAHLQAVFLRG